MLLILLPFLLVLSLIKGQVIDHHMDQVKLQMEDFRVKLWRDVREYVHTEIDRKFAKEEEYGAIKEEVEMAKLRLRALERAKYDSDEKIEKINSQIKELQDENDSLRRQIQKEHNMTKKDLPSLSLNQSLKETPAMLTCAYTRRWNAFSSRITYDFLVSNFSSSGGAGSLDPDTGLFQCVTPGYYLVALSGWAELDPGEWALSALYRNGQFVEGSQWESHYRLSEGQASFLRDQGARTLIVELGAGDILQWRTREHEYFTGELWDLTLCISLTAPL